MTRSNRQYLCEREPGLFFLDHREPASLEFYLREKSVLQQQERILSCERAGEGNMNCTVRVRTPVRSLIVKQSRPWVEKYPQFPAPWDRSCREAEFYALIRPHPAVQFCMPTLYHADLAMRLLVLQDFGEGADYSDCYTGRPLSAPVLEVLVEFLSALHAAFDGPPTGQPLTNREMRALNHSHIFEIPLQSDNGLDLDALEPGLADAASQLRADRAYVQTIGELGAHYLADGPHLVHGDFFPGSFLRTPGGPKVIDPEFGFFGQPEFDLGVMLAHLCLARQLPAACRSVLSHYQPPPGFQLHLALQFAGAEIMRRLLGYAQLPLTPGLDNKRRLLQLSRQLVLESRPDLLFDFLSAAA